jgi:hypothetical protein
MEWRRFQLMQSFTPALPDVNQTGVPQRVQVFGDRLAADWQILCQFRH